jgi:hypothetical protein
LNKSKKKTAPICILYQSGRSLESYLIKIIRKNCLHLASEDLYSVVTVILLISVCVSDTGIKNVLRNNCTNVSEPGHIYKFIITLKYSPWKAPYGRFIKSRILVAGIWFF